MHSTIRILASLALALLLAANLTGCSQEGAAENVAAAQLSPLDAKIDSYEKAANEYVRLSRKHTTGDVSITVLLIQARTSFKAEKASLQKEAPQMSPQQSQKVAAISAKADPFLPK